MLFCLLKQAQGSEACPVGVKFLGVCKSPGEQKRVSYKALAIASSKPMNTNLSIFPETWGKER